MMLLYCPQHFWLRSVVFYPFIPSFFFLYALQWTKEQMLMRWNIVIMLEGSVYIIALSFCSKI